MNRYIVAVATRLLEKMKTIIWSLFVHGALNVATMEAYYGFLVVYVAAILCIFEFSRLQMTEPVS